MIIFLIIYASIMDLDTRTQAASFHFDVDLVPNMKHFGSGSEQNRKLQS